MVKSETGNGKHGETHEASMSRAITTYFRVAQLGTPNYFLAMLHVNHMFTISNDPIFFGWIAFGQVRNYVMRHHTAPSYLDHFAPYLAAASFYISRYIKNLKAKGRELYRVILDRVNVVMRNEVFVESILYGVEPHELTDEIKVVHRAQVRFSKRPLVPTVPGKCTGGLPHGLCVQSLHGMVCTVCGRVGQRQYNQHYDDQVESKSKLHLMSLASQKYIADGAMSTLVRVSDPVRSMTRGQFVAWTVRDFRVPYMGSSELDPSDMEALRCGTYHLPACFREWMLFLYDFVKDSAVDRSGREDRINNNWAQAIWIYGYLVWITVHRDMAVGVEEKLRQAITQQDASNTKVYGNPTERRYRFLETHFETANVQYFRVQGSAYRFYPAKLLYPQFEKDLNCSDSVNVFADKNVRSLLRLGESQSLKQEKVRAQFWDGRYVAAVSWSGSPASKQTPTFQVRAAPHSDECYFHIMVPKHVRVKFVAMKYAQFVLDVQSWNDEDLLTRHPNAAHYFVHIASLRGPSICAKLVYQVGKDTEKTLSIRGLVPTMSKQVFKIGSNVPLLIRATRLTLTPVTKSWVQAQMPE
jgi:hypothetical protein